MPVLDEGERIGATLDAFVDLRHPAVKLPGFGRVGLDDGTALAAPAGAL